jgi:cytochrome c oxidase assembly protein subunit 15
MNRQKFFRLSFFVTLFALVVIVVGAFVRLSDAGLGCPDWPGCYGHIDVPDTHHEVKVAEQNFPQRPVEAGKAWKEMVHRYLAGTLGLLILALAFMARKTGFDSRFVPRLSIALVILVGFQALLGMWTVTLLVKPAIVTLHLLFGMATVSLLWLMTLNASSYSPSSPAETGCRPLGILALLAVIAQIALGGWTSTNYAALACTSFPGCYLEEAWPAMDFADGFVLWRGLGINYEYGVLSAEARAAVHMTHRIGALFVLFIVGGLALRLLVTRLTWARRVGAVIAALLLLQVSLGIANVVASLPLLNAVAHNGVAALLLLSLIGFLYIERKNIRVH